MNLEEFKSQAEKEDRNGTTSFGEIDTEISTLGDFKTVKKTYNYTDKSSQSFQFYFYANQEVKEAEFLTHLTNYKD